MTLGEHIREIRKMQGKTLKEVADSTGLSIAFLSQLETNKCSATMATLRKIADVLQVHPSNFFSVNDVETPAADISPNFEYMNLSRGLAANFTPQQVTIRPYQNVAETVSHPGSEFVYCISGPLTLHVGEHQYQLETGMSYMYDATIPHYWYNHTDQDIVFLVVNEMTK